MNGKSYIFKGARVIDPARGVDAVMDIGVAEGRVVDPGADRQPGGRRSQREDSLAGLHRPACASAPARQQHGRDHRLRHGCCGGGGFTSIVAMPNTNPPADTAGAIEFLRQTAAQKGVVHVLPCGCMTKNYEGREMAGIGSLKAAGVVALSDDGRLHSGPFAHAPCGRIREILQSADSRPLRGEDARGRWRHERREMVRPARDERHFGSLRGAHGCPQHHPRPPDRLEDPYAACQRQGERGAAPQRPGRRGFRSPAKRRRTT